MKHTPGPWNYYGKITLIGDPDKDGIRNHWVGSITPDGTYRGPICSIQSCDHIEGITREEAEANAALIAKAPEMVELLRDIGSLLERGELNQNSQDPGDDTRIVFTASDIYALSDDITRLLGDG